MEKEEERQIILSNKAVIHIPRATRQSRPFFFFNEYFVLIPLLSIGLNCNAFIPVMMKGDLENTADISSLSPADCWESSHNALLSLALESKLQTQATL